MNLKLKQVLPRLIPRACWKHTLLPGATWMLLFPYGSPSQVGDAAGPRQSVAHLRGAGPAAHRSTGMSVLLCSAEPLTSAWEMLPCSCAYDITKESSDGAGWSPPHPTLKVRPWKHVITQQLVFFFFVKEGSSSSHISRKDLKTCTKTIESAMPLFGNAHSQPVLIWDGEYCLGLCRGRAGEGRMAQHNQSPKVRNTSARMKESGTWQLDRVLLSLYGGPQQPVEPVKSSSITHKADPLCSGRFGDMQ